MSKKIYIVILLLEVLNGIWCFYRIKRYNTIIRKKENKEKKKEKFNYSENNILIVIPCLREQEIIISTLNHFLKITGNFKNIKILVVTTQREEYEKQKNLYKLEDLINDIKNNKDFQQVLNKYNSILTSKELKEIFDIKDKKMNIEEIVKEKIKKSKTTNQVVSEYIQQNNLEDRIYHFHYPKNKGIMADQLNYVLHKFKFDNEEKYYFSVYNADSIPNDNTIKEVLEMIKERNNPRVIQQYSVPLSNWKSLKGVMKGFAIYQANFELRYGLINATLPNDFLYTYVVGHGLYFRVDALKELGGFETKYWCEDIYMSYVLRNKKIKINPIKKLEIMQSPESLTILTQQNAVWYKTSFECLKMFKDVVKKDKRINLSSLGWMIQRIRMNITWISIPLAFMITMIISIINNSLSMLIIAIITYIFMIVLEYGSTINLIEKLTNNKIKSKINILLDTIIAVTISNIGPIYSLLSNKKEKYKTIR